MGECDGCGRLERMASAAALRAAEAEVDSASRLEALQKFAKEAEKQWTRAERAESSLVPLVKLLWKLVAESGDGFDHFYVQDEMRDLGLLVGGPYDPGDPIYVLTPEWQARVDAVGKETT